MTTAVERESGQSLIEFMLMLPAILALTVLMIKVNTAIQVSIVNQKYARAQALFIAYNSPVYPKRGQIMPGINRMTVGIADNLAPTKSDEDYTPEATMITITRPGKPVGSDEAKKEPRQRGKVRIRNTVALCTQVNWIGDKSVLRLAEGDPYPSAICRSGIDE